MSALVQSCPLHEPGQLRALHSGCGPAVTWRQQDEGAEKPTGSCGWALQEAAAFVMTEQGLGPRPASVQTAVMLMASPAGGLGGSPWPSWLGMQRHRWGCRGRGLHQVTSTPASRFRSFWATSYLCCLHVEFSCVGASELCQLPWGLLAWGQRVSIPRSPPNWTGERTSPPA